MEVIIMSNEVQKIHDATVEILEKTGVKFHHPDAIQVLKDHGIRLDGNVAYFTESQLMKYVDMAPSTAHVTALDPKYSVTFGDGKSYLGPSAGPVQIVDLEGKRRSSTFADYVRALKLFESNPRYSINGGSPCYPGEVPPDQSEVFQQYVTMMVSNKTPFAVTGSYKQVEGILDMVAATWGCTKESMVDDPKSFDIVNVNSPLQLDLKMTETLFTFLKYRQPVVVTSAAMAGSTAPITPEGTIAQVNAEVMSTIALSQMFAPGAPVLYGSQSAVADMKTLSIAIGAPESALCYRYAAQMAEFYGIPCRAGGCLSDAKKLDAQCGLESMLSFLACEQNGVSLIMQSAGILNGYLDLSFEKIACDFDIIDYVDRYLADITVDEDTVPLETIDNVNQSGSYVVEDHTLEYYRDALISPSVCVRGAVASEDAFEEATKARLAALEAKYVVPERSSDQVEAMRDVLVSNGIDLELADMLDKELAEEPRRII